MRGICLLVSALAFFLGALGCSRTEPEETPSVKQRKESQKEKKQQTYMTE